MSNAARGDFAKGKRDGSGIYKQRDRRSKNKARAIARDKARAKPLKCGHGKRHLSPYDNRCRRCFARST